MIEVDNLSFGYHKDKPVLKDLSLRFGEGFNVIVGPNAAGKSTFLRCLFGLFPHDGEIRQDGRDLDGISVEERMDLMAYLPQEETGPVGMTVFEMVLLGRLPSLGWKVREEDTDVVMKVLDILHLRHLALRPFHTLSGGQQKLVSIAQTLVRKPRVVLMDEPTNSLDLQKQLELCETIRRIVADYGIQFVVVLHDLNLAGRFADEIFVFNGDRGLYSHGTPEQVITEEMLRDVYGVNASIAYDRQGVPVVAPFSSIRQEKKA